MQLSRILIFGLCAFGALLFFIGCGGGSSAATSPTPERITFAGVGTHGIFDPSLARDPASGRIWMSYSAVDPSVLWPTQNVNVVATRLAYSDDNGKTWTGSSSGAIINNYSDVTLSLTGQSTAGTWVNEVSQLVYDPNAIAAERWKILWHHYLTINNIRHFEHGWLGMKTASKPEDLAAATEVKLFAGYLYDSANNTMNGTSGSPVGGAPQLQLDSAFPALSNCAFSEPGMYASGSALYLSLLCVKISSLSPVTISDHPIVLLKCSGSCTTGSNWSYVGTLLNDSNAAAIGYDTGFSASGLFESAGSIYLVATPVQTAGAPWPNYYSGCRVYRFSNIDSALLQTSGSPPHPTLIGSVNGTAGSFNGACAYDASANMSGMLYSEANASVTDIFRIYMSHKNF